MQTLNQRYQYTYEDFDSRNTCTKYPLIFDSVLEAQKYAQKLSRKNKGKKAIVHSTIGTWQEYKNGELTSWSYPNGLGYIKLNI